MFELVLRAPEARVEAVSDSLMDDLGALSVSVEDADAGSDNERALFGEPGMPAPGPGWQRSTLRALFDDEAGADRAAAALLASSGPAPAASETGAGGVHLLSITAVAEQDWVRSTQSQFEPVEITPALWVVPSWHAPPAGARHAIRLDPGLAFGTGTHPTTRMCLRWLATRAPAGARLLDYGCGSGILAIAAAMLGASAVDAVDIDPAAVQATRANAAANGVAVNAGTASTASGAYGVVVANILATPLRLLAPLLCSHVSAGGDLVLAGILQRQAEELRSAYAPWLALEVVDAEDGWILMHARSAAPAAAGESRDVTTGAPQP